MHFVNLNFNKLDEFFNYVYKLSKIKNSLVIISLSGRKIRGKPRQMEEKYEITFFLSSYLGRKKEEELKPKLIQK